MSATTTPPTCEPPPILAQAELEAIRTQAAKIKRFVARHGERSARIFARALAASFRGPERFTEFLISEPDEDEPVEACTIVRALGRQAASLVPLLISGYYRNCWIDRQA
jgi:hypothetical protein